MITGTGIHLGQITVESRDWLQHADKVLYCVSDPASERAILALNNQAESLFFFYGEGKRRSETYKEMIDRTLECLEACETLAVAYYGHPGFFVYPSHQSIRLARERGHRAIMLPSVSSFDCLIADLGISLTGGCQIFEASDLMIHERSIDVCSHLVLMQVSSLGDFSYSFKGFDHKHLESLREYLLSYYPANHRATVYYASQFAVTPPRIEEVAIEELTTEKTKSVATLYLPPLRPASLHLRRIKEYNLEGYLLDGKRLVPMNIGAGDERV